MRNIFECLNNGEILVCDGAMGTMLQDAGLKQGQVPESWNTLMPRKIIEIHKAYIENGADIILTNTFGANPIKLKKAKFADEDFVRLNAEAVNLANTARQDKDVFIFADIGPTGGLIEPLGNLKMSEALLAYKQQAEVLANEGVDGFIIQTMSDIGELKAAVSACSGFSLPVIAMMTFSDTNTGYKTVMGVSVEEFVEFSRAEGIKIFGANCSIAIEDMVGLVAEFKKYTREDEFIAAQPNAGMPKLLDDKTIYEETPEFFARYVQKLTSNGARIIGGCCGTTPEHINRIANIVHRK